MLLLNPPLVCFKPSVLQIKQQKNFNLIKEGKSLQHAIIAELGWSCIKKKVLSFQQNFIAVDFD